MVCDEEGSAADAATADNTLSGRGASYDDEEGEEQPGVTCDGDDEEEEAEVDQMTAPCNHRVWYSTNHYTPTDPVRERVQNPL